MQCQIFRHGIGGLGIDLRGFVHIAVELIGVGEFRRDVRRGVGDGLQFLDGFIVLAHLPVVAGQGALHIGIIRSAAFRDIQVVARLVVLLQVLIAHGQQDFRAGAGRHALRSPQSLEGGSVVAGAQLQLAEQHFVVHTFGIRGHNFLEQILSFLGATHDGFGLREPGKSFHSARLETKPMVIGVNRQRKVVVQASGVSEQEPEMGIAGRGLGCALGERLRLRVVALFQSQLRGASQTRVLNVRSPSQGLSRRRRLAGPLLRLCRTLGVHRVRLCASNPNQDEEENRQNCSLQVPRSGFRHTN